MKNIIAITSLLAAGTALANAGESIVIDVNNSDFTVNGSTATKLIEGLTISITASGSLTTSVTIAGDATKAGWYDSTKSTLFVGDNAWGLDASSTYLVSGKSSSSALTVTISGYESNQAGIELSFVAGVPFEGAGTWANYATLGGVNSTVAGTAYYVGYYNGSGKNLETIDLPTTGTVTPFSAVIYDFSGLTADASGTISFTVDGIDSHSAGLSAIKVSTIPEPSAFGLLAGLGALALVASRRRRSRK